MVARAELAARLTRDPELFLVAEVSGDVVVVVMGASDGRRGWRPRLAVDPRHRRRGIARRLVAELAERFAALDYPRVKLLVMPDNASGLGFWQALGYLPCPDMLCTKPMRHTPVSGSASAVAGLDYPLPTPRTEGRE